MEQIIGVSNRALRFRKEQRDLLHGNAAEADHSNCAHAVAAKRQRVLSELKRSGKMTLGDVTSLNITSLQAGMGCFTLFTIIFNWSFTTVSSTCRSKSG